MGGRAVIVFYLVDYVVPTYDYQHRQVSANYRLLSAPRFSSPFLMICIHYTNPVELQEHEVHDDLKDDRGWP